jgi:tripartite-type tricarboxylate transporter receptor subunit TctC
MKGFKAALAATLVVGIACAAQAQDFPTRPIRLIAPLAAGGVTDMAARLLAERAGKYLGQPMVVENRPGAGGLVGSGLVASAPPDGYTILMGTIGTLAVSPSMYKKMPYDTDKDLIPVSLVAGGQFALAVHPSFPSKTFGEFLEYVKARPGELNYGSAGNGSTLHLGMEMLNSMAGLKITHVPYKGTGPMVAALAGGEIQIGLPDLPSALPFARSERVRILAVTSGSRAQVMPEVPTIAESGLKDYEVVVWLGVMAPAGTPGPVIEKLNSAIVQALKDKDIVEKLAEVDMKVFASSPEQFGTFIKRERAKWDPIVKASGAQIE